jgi:hypothetical protein
MRTFGLSIFGLFGGLLVGFLLTDVIARVAMSDGAELGDSLPLALLLGFAPIALAILGAVAIPLVDHRLRRPDSTKGSRPSTGAR